MSTRRAWRGSAPHPMRGHAWLQVVLVVVALAVGAVVAVLLIRSRQAPLARAAQTLGPLVSVEPAMRQDVPVVIEGHGAVRPAVQVEVVPQVAGQIVELHPAMVDGGFFDAGDVLLRIDPTDYELAMAEAAAQHEQAEAERLSAEARLVEARVELADAHIEVDHARTLHAKGAATPRELDRAELVVERAEAVLQGADAALRRADAVRRMAGVAVRAAEVSLERTRLTLPFDGRVLDERVDLGRHVRPGDAIATVYGTDLLEIDVPLQDGELAWFDVPRRAAPADGNADGPDGPPGATANPEALPGPEAEVSVAFAGRSGTWAGRVVRSAGQVDARSRMVHVVVQVPGPADGRDADLLVPGMFVQVAITGRVLHDVITVPLHALRDGDRVWVVADGRLRVRPVQVVRRTGDAACIRSGLAGGELVVTTALDIVTDGMVVRVSEAAPEVAGHE